jgi:hypothetical protein
MDWMWFVGLPCGFGFGLGLEGRYVLILLVVVEYLQRGLKNVWVYSVCG